MTREPSDSRFYAFPSRVVFEFHFHDLGVRGKPTAATAGRTAMLHIQETVEAEAMPAATIRELLADEWRSI